MKIFTPDELKKFDGKNGAPVYVAFQGKVYDVTESSFWAEGEHFEHLAGCDLTAEMDDAPHAEEVFEDAKLVGKLNG